jgi:hypothetical protein
MWVPALQQLQQIYIQNGWGWDSYIYNNFECWNAELMRMPNDPHEQLFPVHRRRKNDYKKELQKQPQTPQQQEPQKPTHQTPEQTRNNWINQLQNNPDNTLARDILVRNYNMSRQEINDIIARTSDCLAIN